jgi:hypothetical protein
MAKSLKKYKKPPRTAREPSEKEVVLPVQRKAMAALGISPETTPVKKAKRKRPNKKHAIKEDIKQDISDTESDTRVDSGTEEGGIELLLPVSLFQACEHSGAASMRITRFMSLTLISLLPFHREMAARR